MTTKLNAKYSENDKKGTIIKKKQRNPKKGQL